MGASMRVAPILAAAMWAAASPAFGLDMVIATPEQGAAVVRADDDFTRALTPADLAIRLQREHGAASELKDVYAEALLVWPEEERARLEAMRERVGARLAALAPWLPQEVLLVKNSARLDGGLPHTRGAAIFLGPQLPAADDQLDGLVMHELFHVLSRHNAPQRDAFYAIIGFERCASVEFDGAVRARMFTNPDAPHVLWASRTLPEEDGLWFTPVLEANSPHFDRERPEFTSYFALRFYVLTRDAAGHCALAHGPDGPAELAQDEAMRMIFAHAGANTTYVLHPEELMADNFAQLMMGRADAPDPWVHEKLAAILGLAR